MSPDMLRILLLLDGKPGHQNQSMGLVEALSRRVECTCHRVEVLHAEPWRERLRRVREAVAAFPGPDLVVGAGHKVHLPLLWAKWKTGAKAVVLMKPSLPARLFDLCLVPLHDANGKASTGRIETTLGALNRVRFEPSAKDPKAHLALIGGPSKEYGWDGEDLLAGMREVAYHCDGNWMVTDSRRTPAGFLDELSAKMPFLPVSPSSQTPPDWLPAQLRTASVVWVTEDSVSMIYEALSSGARVGLLPMPRKGESGRISRGVDQLVRDGYVIRFADWRKTRQMVAPPAVQQEADRCAGIVLARFFGQKR